MHLHCISTNEWHELGRQTVCLQLHSLPVSQSEIPTAPLSSGNAAAENSTRCCKSTTALENKIFQLFFNYLSEKKKNLIFTTFSYCRHTFKLSFSDLEGVITQSWLLEMLNFHLYQWKLHTSKNQTYTYPI